MNHREIPHRLARRREALSCLAAALLAPAGVIALPRPGSAQSTLNAVGYLSVVGAPQLRFQAKPFVAEPVAKATVTSTATEASASSQPDFISPKLGGARDNMTDPSSSTPAEKALTQPSAPAPKPPPPIIQDDLRPAVRAEDFLPYFQMPGSARNPGDVTLITPVPRSAPAPAAIPPSSATYTQTPK